MLRRILSVTLLAGLIGIIASLGAVFFVFLVSRLNELLWVSLEFRNRPTIPAWQTVIFLMVPAAGGLLSGLLCKGNPDARPLSLADTISSAQSLVFSTPSRDSLRTSVACVVALGSGASLGHYTPIAFLGSSIGLQAQKWFRESGFTATMGIGCGAAAAISAAFSAPIAGLVFAHEVILRHYSLRSFAPITVASVTGYMVSSYGFERARVFRVPEIDPIHSVEFLVFMLMGVAGALIATFFIRSTLLFTDYARSLAVPSYMKPAMAGLIVGIVGLWLPEVLGIGQGVMKQILHGSGYPAGELMILLFAKVLLTALCLGFGVAGGVFSPALLSGMMFGALVIVVAEPVLGAHFSSPIPYIACGLTAVMSPVIGAPLTAILIIFELTGSYQLAVSVMVCVAFANLIGYRLAGRSIFDVQLALRGMHLSLGRDRAILESRNISAFISTRFVTVRGDETLDHARDLLLNNRMNEVHVVDENRCYLGSISLMRIVQSEQQGGDNAGVRCGSLCVQDRHMTPGTSIWNAIEQIRDFTGESIPVLDDKASEGVLLGVVHQSSIIEGYLAVMNEVRNEEHGTG